MTEDAVYELLRAAVLRTLPDLDGSEIRPEATLQDLGANSVDRLDILMEVGDALGGHVTVRDLTGRRDVGGLVRTLHERRGDAR
jgi:polyketide biosynthesis acyl carrier protein